MLRADSLATLKRSWCIILGKHQVYMRAPEPKECDVTMIQYSGSRTIHDALLNPSGVAKLHHIGR
eukprot:5792328-Amphidinium_carterae.1